MNAHDQSFWQRIDEARLLLMRLNDDDIDCPGARALLVRRYETKLGACRAIYEAWCYITIRAKKLMNREYELDPWWEQRYISCSDHIFDRCMMYLDAVGAGEMDQAVVSIFSDVIAKTRWELGAEND